MMKQKTEHAESCPSSGYVSPEVYVLHVCVERGYEISIFTGSDGKGITVEDYNWLDDIEL